MNAPKGHWSAFMALKGNASSPREGEGATKCTISILELLAGSVNVLRPERLDEL